MKILFATSNQNKIQEAHALLSELGHSVEELRINGNLDVPTWNNSTRPNNPNTGFIGYNTEANTVLNSFHISEVPSFQIAHINIQIS